MLCIALQWGCIYLCFRCCYAKVSKYDYIVIFLSILPAFWWLLGNPLYTQGPRLELSYRKVDPFELTNWANTFVHNPSEIVAPQSVNELCKIVMVSNSVRVIGAGHSWSPLVETTGSLIDMKHFDTVSIGTNTVVVGAGTSLQTLSDRLQDVEKMFIGFGAIKKQTVGGASATSLHGDHHTGFSTHIRSLKAVLANGSLIETTDMQIWRDSMGMLGVIYEFNITVYPLQYVNVKTNMQTFSYVQELMKNDRLFDATILSGTTSLSKSKFRTRVVSEAQTKRIDTILQQPRIIYYVWDNIVLPFVVLTIGMFGDIDLSSVIHKDEYFESVPITEAWNHPSEYGFVASEYAIPVENCSAAFEEIYDISPGTVSYEVRLLKGAPHCTSWVQEKSCALAVSPLNLHNWKDLSHNDFFLRIEEISYKYGGSVHIGKYIAGSFEKQRHSLPCFDLFNRTRAQLDPTNKFINNFGRKYLFTNETVDDLYVDKTVRHIVFSLVAYIVILVVLLYVPVNIYYGKSCNGCCCGNGYSLLQPKPK